MAFDDVMKAPTEDTSEPHEIDDVRRFAVNKMVMGQYLPQESLVRSLDFHADGKLIVTANEQSTLNIINAVEGRWKKTINCHKYGAGIVRFTHSEHDVLVTSTLGDDHAVRNLSLYDVAYQRQFKGHTGRVTSMDMNPAEDRFLSGAADGTVRLWDMRERDAIAILRFPDGFTSPMVTYDPQGLAFFVACSQPGANIIKLFDARSYDGGPFATLELDHRKISDFITANLPSLAKQAPKLAGAQWTRLRTSLDGNSFLISTNASLALLVDSFEGTLKQAYSGHVNRTGSDLDACFSPDARWVVSGSEDGVLRVWDANEGTLAATLQGHDGPVTRVNFSAQFEVAATAGSGVALWIAPPEGGQAGKSGSGGGGGGGGVGAVSVAKQ